MGFSSVNTFDSNRGQMAKTGTVTLFFESACLKRHILLFGRISTRLNEWGAIYHPHINFLALISLSHISFYNIEVAPLLRTVFKLAIVTRNKWYHWDIFCFHMKRTVWGKVMYLHLWLFTRSISKKWSFYSYIACI